jgi:hypothetical protein
LFSVFLGDTNLPNMQPLTADIFTNAEVSLRIWFDDGLNGSIQLTPDTRLGSVPYALSANVASAAIDPAKLASANPPQSGQLLSYDGTGFRWLDRSAAEITWALNGTDTYYTAGRVGVGLSTPVASLHVQSSRASGLDNTATFYNPSLGPYASHIHYGAPGDWYIRSAKNTGKVVLQDTGGSVGIGTAAPAARCALEVRADWLVNGPNILLTGPSPTLQWDAPPEYPAFTSHSWIAHLGASHGIEFWHRAQSSLPGGDTGWNVKAGFTTDGGLWYAGRLDKLDTSEQPYAIVRAHDLSLGHSGRRGTPGRALVDMGTSLVVNFADDWGETVIGGNVTQVKTLRITGGADLAEPFAMSHNDITPGTVVVIDEEHPGRLKLSAQAYDTRVAGIVSGANGVNPGIALHQEGVLEGGQNVALSGRVYVQADAQQGAIRPGDLLTTSSVPGHAMKVTDHARAQGAILGKAMSALAEGQGMVLVLVTLQ